MHLPTGKKWKTCRTPELQVFTVNKTLGCNKCLVILTLLLHPHIVKKQSLAEGAFNIWGEGVFTMAPQEAEVLSLF